MRPRAPRLRAPALALAVLALLAGGGGSARAQQPWPPGTCAAGATPEACYRQGLEQAEKALRPVDEEGLRGALRLFVAVCDRGLGDACYVAGRMTAAEMAGVTRALATPATRAARLFAKGCQADRPSGAACNALGLAPSYAPEDFKEDSALHYLRRGCEMQNPTACVRAALRMNDWPGAAARTPTLPAALAHTACAGGSPEGCVAVANRAAQRLSPAGAGRLSAAQRREREAVRDGYRQACRAGLPTACTRLGATFGPEDPAFSANPDSARFYLEMACSGQGGLWKDDPPRLGDGAGCTEAGHQRVHAAATRADTAAAVPHFDAGCALLDSHGCADLAYYGFLTESVPGHLALLRAVAACYEKVGYGCWVAGFLYQQPGLDDVEQVEPYHHRACRLDYGPGCAELGRLLAEDGRPEALKYLRRACALRDGAGCRMYGEQLVENDLAERADVFVLRGCALGDAEACWEAMEQARESQDAVREGEYRSRACRLDPYFCKLKPASRFSRSPRG